MTVAILNNNPGQISVELARYLLRETNTPHRNYVEAVMLERSGANLSIFRNRVMEKFLKECDCEWAWFIDSDIEPDESTLPALLEHADPESHPVVAGTYVMSVGQPVFPAYYLHRQPDGSAKYAPVWKGPTFHKFPRDTLLPVDGTGMGCTLIHRSVVVRMVEEYGWPQPWFSQSVHAGVEYGEDLSFYYRLSHEMNPKVPVHLHTGIVVGHLKTTRLDYKQLGIKD